MVVVADALSEVYGYGSWFTTGSWPTERESASAFDQYITAIGMFRMYPEVSGTLIQPRARQQERALRIDRILVPTQSLRDLGWQHGAIGVELKRSKINIGPPLAQAMDYVRGVFEVGGISVQLSAVFLWPMSKQAGPLASVMVHQRIGSATPLYGRVMFALGEEVLLDGTRLGLSNGRSGRRVGSR